ncbi:SDR family oxidoreductase [Brevibacillus fulvus]|uniref:NAD(P)-dependent dehydrogenase (Short-subunit alcohol dehydrogenase family) n=1 Tax=Brevibacillus fulvus TaxID=1125967 RepID=A0A938XVU7_9BACL|nr:SDR family oxidoreductase [Brevibacillus fulvus]MBM7591097.1 NAD(P)-dependent dehydrogenase (short-subunit alcohol dehydrogenase family) [Brevibacillus fulvus]
MKNKVAVITGSSSGFGCLTSIALAKAGYHVFATMRTLERSGQLADTARKEGVSERITCIQLDVTEFSRIPAVIEQIVKQAGQIDLLVNNAGYAAGGFVEELPLPEWQRQFATNVFGVIAVTQAVLPHMRARRQGRIINVGSISGRIGFPGLAPYAASKHALEGFSESLRLEMKPFQIEVVLIEPGAYRTAIWDKGFRQLAAVPDSPYATLLGRLLAEVKQITGAAQDPSEVVQAIVKAATVGQPRFRYPVGKGIRMLLLAKALLPWNWLEKLIAKRLNH